MKKFLWILALATCLAMPACRHADGSDVRTVRYALDGDTLMLENGEKVRMIGVDTPEIHDDDYHRNATHAARYGLDPHVVDEYAFKAKDFARQAVEGQEVRLVYEGDRIDKFNRTLAYVYRASDGLFLDAELVKQGYGFAYTRFPFKYARQFVGYQTDAWQNHRGLWYTGDNGKTF